MAYIKLTKAGKGRDTVKLIRDRAKSRYKKEKKCRICEIATELDFHHYYSLSPLLHNWIKVNKLRPEDVLEFRDDFIESHIAELYEYTVTLCHSHHLRLHSVYGRNPRLSTALKQKRWVEIQREKI